MIPCPTPWPDRLWTAVHSGGLLWTAVIPQPVEKHGCIARKCQELQGASERSWRREWDSNPRYGCPYTRFPSVRLQPLGHPSAALAHGGRPALGQVGGEYRCGDRERKRIGALRGRSAPQGSAPPPAALVTKGSWLPAPLVVLGRRGLAWTRPPRDRCGAAILVHCGAAARRADGEPAATRST